MDFYHSSRIACSDYYLLRNFYGRDLGGERYFEWKHRKDTALNNKKRVIYCEDNGEKIGIIFTTQYQFSSNHGSLTVNLIGDLGVNDSIKSPSLVKNLLLSAHCFESDASLCFSDDRKIAIYDAIFKRNLNTINQNIAYEDVTIKTFSTDQAYTTCPLDKVDFQNFRNHLGRSKDKNYLSYLEKHPCYRDVLAIQNTQFTAILGVTDDFVEVLDISGTSNEHFLWAIRASNAFHEVCKILLPRSRTALLCHATGELLETKPLNLMVSWYTEAKYTFDTDNTWICRLDRR